MSSQKKTPPLRTQWLGGQLRELRTRQSLTLIEVGDDVQRSESSLSKMENGIIPIPRDVVELLLDRYLVNEPGRREAILRFAEDAWRSDWWAGYADEIPETLIDFVWLEERATEVRAFYLTTLHGLVQTPDYARAFTRATDPDESNQQIERWVDLRIRRHVSLTRAEPLRLSLVLGEELLGRAVGGSGVMTAQLKRLAEQAQQDNIEIRVFPLAAGEHPSPGGNFQIFVMPEPFSEIVCLDTPAGIIYLEPPKTERFMAAHQALLERALAPDESLELITQTATRMEDR